MKYIFTYTKSIKCDPSHSSQRGKNIHQQGNSVHVKSNQMFIGKKE